MFKNKSPMGKENLINDWFVNEQTKIGLSPAKNHTSHSDHSFANARKAKNIHHERLTQQPQTGLIKHLSDPFDLECNETL